MKQHIMHFKGSHIADNLSPGNRLDASQTLCSAAPFSKRFLYATFDE